MKYKKYRMCLLSIVIIAVIGGIFYYESMKNTHDYSEDGTFVERECERIWA